MQGANRASWLGLDARSSRDAVRRWCENCVTQLSNELRFVLQRTYTALARAVDRTGLLQRSEHVGVVRDRSGIGADLIGRVPQAPFMRAGGGVIFGEGEPRAYGFVQLRDRVNAYQAAG